MIIIKGLLLIGIIISSAMAGILVSKKYSKRVEELKEMKNALNIFKTKVKFTYEPIPEIFKEISYNLKENVGEIFLYASHQMKEKSAGEAWKDSVDKANTNLIKEDINLIKGLSKLLRKNRCRRTNK